MTRGDRYRETGTTYVRLGKARMARLRRTAGKEHGALQAALRLAVDLYLDATRRGRGGVDRSVRPRG